MKPKLKYYRFITIIVFLFSGLTINLYSSHNLPISNPFSIKNLSGTDFVILKNELARTENDSLVSNKITKVWYTATELNVQIYQVFKQQDITITVYNMLGKEVLEVFKGISSNNQEEVYSKSFNLPNGIYICIMQGKNFKSSEKFIISR